MDGEVYPNLNESSHSAIMCWPDSRCCGVHTSLNESCHSASTYCPGMTGCQGNAQASRMQGTSQVYVANRAYAHSSSELRRSALSRSGDGVGVLRQIDEAPLSASRCRFRARLHIQDLLEIHARNHMAQPCHKQARQCRKVYPGSDK